MMNDLPDPKATKGADEGGLMNYVGIGLLIVAYLIAIANTLRIRSEEMDPNVPVIRICHWQLELGVRDALNVLARDYEKEFYERTGRRVRVIQNAIPERAYRQYVTTQCIGGTAPDLIQYGSQLDMRFMNRYFIPLSEIVNQPNPYNKGTELEGVPWIDTFNDGLNSALDQDGVEYLGIGFSAFTQRLFYNRTLMREATGSPDVPRGFREFIATCEKLQDWARRREGREEKDDFVPIAGGRYQIPQFLGKFREAVTLRFAFEKDVNYDGLATGYETLFAYLRGRHSFTDPAFRALNEMIRATTRYFIPGFTQMDRQDAVFRFTQGNAAFIASGSWDAMTLIHQSEFEVGVVDLPIPTRADPEFGHLVSGPTKEELGTGFLLGLTNFYDRDIPGWEDVPGFKPGPVRKIELTLDFLHFMTTRENNQRFNRICSWIPVIRGARPLPVLEAFMPDDEGYWGANPTNMGQESENLYEQMRSEFLEGRRSFDEMVERMDRDLPNRLANDIRSTRRTLSENDFQPRLFTSRFYANSLFAHEEATRKSNARILAFFWEQRIQKMMERFSFHKHLDNALRTEDPVGRERVTRILREKER